MPVTVRKILQLPELKGFQLLAGESGLDNDIQYVDSMEVPEIGPWLKKWELMMTTGYALKGEEDALLHLIEELHRVQAAGLCIKTRFIGPLPEKALRRADELGLPLIQLPDEMSFAETVNFLIKFLVDDQNRRLEFSEKIHKRFTELELSGGSFEQIGQLLYSALGFPVIITDEQFRIYSMVSPDNEELREQFFNMLDSGFERDFSAMDSQEEFLRGNRDGFSLWVRKARSKERVCGFIFLAVSPDKLDEMARIVLDHAVTTITLEIMKQEALNQHHRLMNDNLFIDIIMQNIKTEEEARYRAQQQSWPQPPLLLAMMDINAFEELSQNRTEYQLLELKKSVGTIITQELEGQGITGAVISQSDRFFCVLSNRFWQQVPDMFQRILDRVREEISVDMTAGYVTGIPSYTGLWQAHNESLDAIHICRIEGIGCACIEDHRLEQAILRGKDNIYLKKYVENTIGKLEQYDRETGSDLLHVLEELVRNMGIRTKTAEALFLHRNTLLYRIKKMEQLTGCDLSRNDHLLHMALALMIRPYL